LGLAIAAVTTLWFCTRERFSIKSEIVRSEKVHISKQPSENQVRYKAALPGSFQSEQSKTTQRANSQTPIKITRQPQRASQSTASSVKQNQKGKTARIHIVNRGETLSSIAYQYYGSSNKWPRIFDANRSRIKEPDKIREGIRLIIPE